MQKKRHKVHEIIDSDRESFGELVGKLSVKDCKLIYNRIYRRLQRKDLNKGEIKAQMCDHIRAELFKMVSPKNEAQAVMRIQENEREQENRNRRFDSEEGDDEDLDTTVFRKMHGVNLWGDNEPTEGEKIDQFAKDYQDAVNKKFEETFCSSCHCEKVFCRCRKNEEY